MARPSREVDFVLESTGRLLAVEVASGHRKGSLPGLDAFRRSIPSARPLAGAEGLPLSDILRVPAGELA